MNGPFWPDPEMGPFMVSTHWAEIDGHLECVGLSLSSIRLSAEQNAHGNVVPVVDDVSPVQSAQLRRAPWKAATERFRQGFAFDVMALGLEEGELDQVAQALIEAGGDPGDASYGEWLASMTPDQQFRAMGFQPTDPAPAERPRRGKGGRRSEFSREEWDERAAVYRSAVERGLSPNKELADRFKVGVGKARNWSAAMRRQGYDLPLPPAVKTRRERS